MKGIPTKHKYRQFRSRLEARWACMFDLLGWKYEYEPYDLMGWIPDFAIFGYDEIIVEVKPCTKLEEFDTNKIINALEGTDKKGKEVLLLGSTIFKSETWIDAAEIGWLGEYSQEDKSYWFEPAIMNKNKIWGFFHAHGSYQDRITGEYDGDNHLSIPEFKTVLRLWQKSGNLVQWKPPA